MKKLLFAGAALAAAAFAVPALAQPGAYNWTGFYAGAHVGYAWAHEDWNQTTSSLALPLDRDVKALEPSGVVGGGQVGYNYQAPGGPWVFGLTGDISATDLKARKGHAVFTSYAGESKINWDATLTGRVGFTHSWGSSVSGDTLIYALGGVAFANEDSFITFNDVQTTNKPSKTRTGWVVGGGVEHALPNRWSIATEYNYMNFGTETVPFTYTAHPAGLIEGWHLKTQEHVVKVRVNYRFR